MPEDITFKTKPEIALDHIRWAHEIGLPGKMALMDTAYGNDSRLRAGVTELGMAYVADWQAKSPLYHTWRLANWKCRIGNKPMPDQGGKA